MTYLVQQKPFRDPLSIFEDFFDNSSRRSIALIDLQEDADHIYVTVEAPGVPKSEIRVEYQERRLRISGERKALNSHVSAGSLHREISVGKFDRSVMVGDVDIDKAKVDYKDGIVSIVLPKSGSQKPTLLVL